MALTPDEVRSIAHLARLGVDDDTVTEMAAELSSVLALVEQLNSVDTTGVEPMAHPDSVQLRLRADIVSEENRREALQRPAPSSQDGFFLVPRVVE